MRWNGAFREYSGKTFAELIRITHKDLAWRNARERDGIIRDEDI
jgi:PAS domain-containing protein